MILQRFYLKCLSHGSYLIADGDSGEAAIIDPQRDADAYNKLLEDKGYRLKYVLETHIHADFVSGHVELAALHGATIVFGSKAHAGMDHLAVSDGDVLMLGKGVEIKVLETPGHTPESVCYLARDMAAPDVPLRLFSGDTVFDGDVGRPDLLGSAMPGNVLASQMYDTLKEKILTLPDGTEIYPAHGAGSACGRNLGDAEFTTLEEQKRTNYALQPMGREEFIKLLTEDLPEAPGYFGEDARINREGPGKLALVMAGFIALDPAAVAEALANGAQLLDTRGGDAYASGHIPGSLQIGLDGQFASWVGSLVPKERPLVILAEEDREDEAALRCARIGHDSIVGYVKGGFPAWVESGRKSDSFLRAQAADLSATVPDPAGTLILDVRSPGERKTGFIPGSVPVPLLHLRDWGATGPKGAPILIHCASGYRSAIAASLLRGMGFTDVRDVVGGLRRYIDAGHTLTMPRTERAK